VERLSGSTKGATRGGLLEAVCRLHWMGRWRQVCSLQPSSASDRPTMATLSLCL
jgi:hypothetical protein